MNLMPPPQNKPKNYSHLAEQQIPWEEIAKHDKADDCWIVMDNVVFDVTDFLDKHPGKPQTIMNRAGKDATKSFQAMYHSKKASDQAYQMAIGVVDQKSKALEGQIEV